MTSGPRPRGWLKTEGRVSCFWHQSEAILCQAVLGRGDREARSAAPPSGVLATRLLDLLLEVTLGNCLHHAADDVVDRAGLSMHMVPITSRAFIVLPSILQPHRALAAMIEYHVAERQRVAILA